MQIFSQVTFYWIFLANVFFVGVHPFWPFRVEQNFLFIKNLVTKKGEEKVFMLVKIYQKELLFGPLTVSIAQGNIVTDMRLSTI